MHTRQTIHDCIAPAGFEYVDAAAREEAVDATLRTIERIHPLADPDDYDPAQALGTVTTDRPDIEWEHRAGYSA